MGSDSYTTLMPLSKPSPKWENFRIFFNSCKSTKYKEQDIKSILLALKKYGHKLIAVGKIYYYYYFLFSIPCFYLLLS